MKIFLAFSLIFMIVSKALSQEGIVFIVNERNPVTVMTPSQIADFYFKRSRTWSDGSPIRFFDRIDDAPEKAVFLRQILHRTSRDIDLYWIGQKLYTGNSAPTQVASESTLASLIARFPGGIGYVSPSFMGAPGVKKIEVKGRP